MVKKYLYKIELIFYFFYYNFRMASKLFKKFTILQDEYYSDESNDIIIHLNYTKNYDPGSPDPYLKSAKYTIVKKNEFENFVNSLVQTLQIQQLMFDLLCYEPNLYYMITKFILGIEYIVPFNNHTFKNAMQNMTIDDMKKKYGNFKYWDVSQVTDYSTYMPSILRPISQFWTLHPTIKRGNLKYHDEYRKYYTGHDYNYNYRNYYTPINNRLYEYIYSISNSYDLELFEGYKDKVNFGLDRLKEIDIELKRGREKRERQEREREKRENKKVNQQNRAQKKEYQKHLRKQNKMLYKNSKCKSHYR